MAHRVSERTEFTEYCQLIETDAYSNGIIVELSVLVPVGVVDGAVAGIPERAAGAPSAAAGGQGAVVHADPHRHVVDDCDKEVKSISLDDELHPRSND